MDSEHEQIETGADTGAARENTPDAPGFTPEHDRLFRSHFQHANRLADRTYEQVRPAYAHGYEAGADPRRGGRSFEEVERDLEAGWLNVRTRVGDWASVRSYVRAGYEARTADDRPRPLGVIADAPPMGGEDTTDRAPFSDPLADDARGESGSR